jgi:ribosomal protein S18 acetylase RimI-like enzyme
MLKLLNLTTPSQTDFGMLATHPSHQHRGAATSLMSELLAEADALGVYTLSFDPAEYGVTGLGVEVQTVMVRGALGKDGIRREVRRWEDIER